ncbi:MAG: helix-turn-helix domain-containing protein [Deltaproteobacteria bacterium]|nr:helix-turn-helix domain-containing protein [Deltaproteobacteria bacterium]
MPNHEDTLGQFLKKEREFRKLTQEDVSKFTRYHISKIQAMEEDHHELLPSQPYVKGMLRSIAKYLGLEVQDLLSRYEEFLRSRGIETSSELAFQQTLKIPSPPFYQGKNFIVVSATIVFIVLVILVSFFFHGTKKMEPLQSIQAPQVQPLSSEKEGEGIGKEHKILFQASQDIWLKIQADSDLPKQMSLKGGKSLELQVKKVIRFFVSEAYGLKLTFDGKEITHGHQGPTTFVLPQEN